MTIKVLVIDDIAHIRRLISRMLEQAGYETLEAANGQQGLNVLRESEPDIITCDVSMPVMDGHQFLAAVREDPNIQTPVILITAIGEAEKAFNKTDLKADAYLTKPFSSNKLIDTIESQLHKLSVKP